jgi:isocitrate dehydrogenase (NAD+)
MAHGLALLHGDGTSAELAEAVRVVIDATGTPVDWAVVDLGMEVLEAESSSLPEAAREAVAGAGVALRTPVSPPIGRSMRALDLELRDSFGLFARRWSFRALPGVPGAVPGVDLELFAQNQEGLASGIEFPRRGPATARLLDLIEEAHGRRLPDDAGMTIKAVSPGGTERLVETAYEFARARGRTRLTLVHQTASEQRASDGLFAHTARNVAVRFPDVVFEDVPAPELGRRLVREPQALDVIVTLALTGELLSGVAAGLVGGFGLVSMVHVGDEVCVFGPAHGPLAAVGGRSFANPAASLLAGAGALRHLGEVQAAERVERALAAVVAAGRAVTPDLKTLSDDPTAVSTREMAEAVARAV